MQHEYETIFNTSHETKWLLNMSTTNIYDSPAPRSLPSLYSNDSWSMGGELSCFPQTKKHDYETFNRKGGSLRTLSYDYDEHGGLFSSPSEYNEEEEECQAPSMSTRSIVGRVGSEIDTERSERRNTQIQRQTAIGSDPVPEGTLTEHQRGRFVATLEIDHSNLEDENSWYHENINIEDFLEEDQHHEEPSMTISTILRDSNGDAGLSTPSTSSSSSSSPGIYSRLKDTTSAIALKREREDDLPTGGEDLDEMDCKPKKVKSNRGRKPKNTNLNSNIDELSIKKEKKGTKGKENNFSKIRKGDNKVASQEKNKQSAKMYRDRKKQEAHQTEQRCNELTEENARMKGEISSIMSQILEYKELLTKGISKTN